MVEGLSRARASATCRCSSGGRARGDDDVAELVASHLWAAVPLGVGERAAGALEAAAEVAVRRYALSSAEDLLERAVLLRRTAGTTDRHAEAELEALVRLTSVRRALRGFGGVADLLDRADALAQRLGRDEVALELQWARWALADTACDCAVGGPIAERFRRLAQTTSDPVLRQFGLHVWGMQCWHAGRLLEMRDTLDTAAEAGRQVTTPPPTYRAGTTSALRSFAAERHLHAECFRLAAHDFVGDLPDAAEHFDRLSRSLDPYGSAILSTFACCAAACRGESERVAELAAAVVEGDADGLLSFWGGQARMHLGWALVRCGEVEQGLSVFATGRGTFAGTGLNTGMGMFLADCAMALLERGRPDDAAPLVADARWQLDTCGERWPEPLVLLAEAQLDRARGGDGTTALRAALDCAQAMGAAGMVRRILRSADPRRTVPA